MEGQYQLYTNTNGSLTSVDHFSILVNAFKRYKLYIPLNRWLLLTSSDRQGSYL
jgi:hypothetical protein